MLDDLHSIRIALNGGSKLKVVFGIKSNRVAPLMQMNLEELESLRSE